MINKRDLQDIQKEIECLENSQNRLNIIATRIRNKEERWWKGPIHSGTVLLSIHSIKQAIKDLKEIKV